jgi:hypothetical protein
VRCITTGSRHGLRAAEVVEAAAVLEVEAASTVEVESGVAVEVAAPSTGVGSTWYPLPTAEASAEADELEEAAAAVKLDD